MKKTFGDNVLKSPAQPPQWTHLDRLARDDQVVDDVAVLLAHAGTRIPSDEDGGRVLEDHEDEEDVTEGRAGRVVARLLCHGHGSTSRWGVLGRAGGHTWCIRMICGCPLPTSYRLHGR